MNAAVSMRRRVKLLADLVSAVGAVGLTARLVDDGSGGVPYVQVISTAGLTRRVEADAEVSGWFYFHAPDIPCLDPLAAEGDLAGAVRGLCDVLGAECPADTREGREEDG